MKSLVVILSMILWFISAVVSFLAGCFFILWAKEEADKEKNGLKLPEDGPRTYSRVYDSASHNWSSDPDVNELFLRSIHSNLLDRLTRDEHVFLNEAFDALGMPRCADGQVYGWTSPLTDDSLWVVDPVEDSKGSYIIHFKTDGPIIKLAG